MLKTSLLLCVMLAGAASGAMPQEAVVRYDSSAVAIRAPAPSALQTYRDDPDFLYDRAPKAARSWWDRFKRWLGEHIFGPLREMNTGPAMRWFFYALAALGIVFAVARLLRMDAAGLFSSPRRPAGLAFEIVEEDIRQVDFDQMIAEAVAARAYRRAVRLLYLKTLKTLAARDLIDWQRDKTNHEYVAELRRPALRRPLAELTTLFEYVWYGDFAVDETTFGRVRGAFARFSRRLQDGETP